MGYFSVPFIFLSSVQFTSTKVDVAKTDMSHWHELFGRQVQECVIWVFITPIMVCLISAWEQKTKQTNKHTTKHRVETQNTGLKPKTQG